MEYYITNYKKTFFLQNKSKGYNLIVTCPYYYNKEILEGFHYGIIQQVLINNHSLHLYISNNIFSFFFSFSRNAKEYKKYLDKFNLEELKNIERSKLRAKIEISYIYDSLEFERFYKGKEHGDLHYTYDKTQNIVFKLNKLKISIFNSNVKYPSRNFDFLFNHYNYIIDMSLLHAKMDNYLYDKLIRQSELSFFYEDLLLWNFENPISKKRYKEIRFSRNDWEEKLKDKIVDAKDFLDKEIEKEKERIKKEHEKIIKEIEREEKIEIEKNKTINNNEIETASVNDSNDFIGYDYDSFEEHSSLEKEGIGYDSDSDLYFQIDIDDWRAKQIQKEYERESMDGYWDAKMKEEESEAKYEKDKELLEDFYFNNELFSKEFWYNGLSSIINDEIIYYLFIENTDKKEKMRIQSLDYIDDYDDDDLLM